MSSWGIRFTSLAGAWLRRLVAKQLDDSGFAVHGHALAAAQKRGQPGYADDRGNAQLACHGGGVREDLAALDEQSGHEGEQGEPTGVDALDDQDLRSEEHTSELQSP